MLYNILYVNIIAFIVLIIAIVGVALQPNFTQIGDNVVSDRYYDTAYEAYKHCDIPVNIEEDVQFSYIVIDLLRS